MIKGIRNPRTALAISIIIAVILRIALAFRPEVLIYTKYFQEDAFYLFNCAEHLAHGDGITADGIHPTNGIQPLIVLIYAPLFLISHFDKLIALRLAFFCCALFDALSMVFLYNLVKLLQIKENKLYQSVWLQPPILAALLWGTLFPVFVHTVSGLETGIYSMMLILSIYFYALILKKRKEKKPVSWIQYFCFGIVLGLTVLARIDAVIFAGMLAFYEFYVAKQKAIKGILLMAIPAFLISLPWWYYNYSTFGNIIPQSGISEGIGINIAMNFWQMISTIADCTIVFFSLTKMIMIPVIYYIGWFILIMCIAIFIYKKWDLHTYLRSVFSFKPLAPLFLTALAFAVYYTFFFAAPHFISRYMQPLRIAMIIVAACSLPFILQKLSVIRFGKVITGLFFLAAFINSFYRYPPNFLTQEVSVFYKVGKWALTIPDAKIGAYQTGASGFIASNIVNLDGKVNYDALLARQNGGIGKYLAETRLDYIADQKLLAKEIVSSAEKYGIHYILVDSIKEVMIYRRVD